MDIDDLCPLDPDAATPTEKKEIDRVLAWFVKRVRSGKSIDTGHCTRSGKSIDAGVLNFIADGVEAHLRGRKPWAAKRGIKKRGEVKDIYYAFPVYTTFRRCRAELLMRGDPYNFAQVCTDTAGELGCSDDTVKRAIATIEKGRETHTGRSALWILELPETLKRFGI